MSEQQIEIFQKGDDKVFWGNSLEVLQQCIPNGTVNLIFADPPYNIGKKFAHFIDRWPSDEAYAEWCYQWLALCIDKLAPTGSMYIMTSTQSMPYLDLYLRQKITILSRIIWHYDSSGIQAQNYFGSMYEPILFCVKNKKAYTFNASAIQVEAKTGAKRHLIDYRKTEPTPYNSTKTPGNVWEFPRVRYRMEEYEEHPSQKPEALLERIICASSNPGDTILDPFAGTFTACAVGQRLERKTIGIELQEQYLKIGLRRLKIQDEYDGETLRPPRKIYDPENKQEKLF